MYLFYCRGCGLPCNKRPELQCLSDSLFADVIEFHTLAVPSGIPVYQVRDLLLLLCIFSLYCRAFVLGLGFLSIV